MIAMLATLIAYLTGFIAEFNQWHYQFQANTTKKRRVISLFFLGCRIIKKKFRQINNYGSYLCMLRMQMPCYA